MAKVLKEFPGDYRGSRAKGFTRYAKFLDGKPWQVSTSDFPGCRSAESIYQSIRYAANKKGFAVRRHTVDANTIVVQTFAKAQS